MCASMRVNQMNVCMNVCYISLATYIGGFDVNVTGAFEADCWLNYVFDNILKSCIQQSRVCVRHHMSVLLYLI